MKELDEFETEILLAYEAGELKSTATEQADLVDPARTPDGFYAIRGQADVKWRTDDLMEVLRGEQC
jgi:hypothetical protein